jgi:hypothetical protein
VGPIPGDQGPDGLDEGAEVTWAQPLITARRRGDDMIERSDSAERIEPALAKEPMANTEANDPMDPIDRTEPILPIERIEFLDPIDRIESFDRIEHQEPGLLIAEIMARRHSDGSDPHWSGGAGSRIAIESCHRSRRGRSTPEGHCTR